MLPILPVRYRSGLHDGQVRTGPAGLHRQRSVQQEPGSDLGDSIMAGKDTNSQYPGSANPDLSAGSPLEALRAALDSATANRAFGSRSDAEKHFGEPAVGMLPDRLHRRLQALLTPDGASGFDTHDLRAAAGGFALERTLGSNRAFDDIMAEILPCFGGGAELKPPTDVCWVEAAEIGLALSMLDCFKLPDQRHQAVTSAAARLVQRGFKLTLAGGRVDRTGPAIIEITGGIRDRLERLGLVRSLASLLATAGRCTVHEFGQYLFGRDYDPVSSEPAIPFGFLLNLAVQASDGPCTSQAPETDWREAVELARDLVAVIDVQPHNKFWIVNIKPRRIEQLLSEVGLYDHLAGFRQWALPVTPHFLESFFGTEHDDTLSERYGWRVTDAVLLTKALVTNIRAEPQRLTRAELMSTGLDGATLDRMLPWFVHAKATVNVGYDSPLAAGKADLMFRPLIEDGSGTYVAPTASILGPACYEAVASAVREALPSKTVSDLVGTGTERSVATLFRSVGVDPSVEGLKYNEGAETDAGECDLVLEDDENVLLIECKAKPLTRATMGEDSFAAVLDYAASVVASQVQALQHERLLRDHGEILFDDGYCLKHKGREITRLSVTLLDHGSLQDQLLFANLVEPLLRSKIVVEPGDGSRRYDALRKQLDRHREEMAAAEGRKRSPWVEALGAAYLSYGQLAIILIENRSVCSLIGVLRTRTTFATMNPLLEYHYVKMSDLI